MKQYLDLVRKVLDTGELKKTRSGDCLTIFDHRLEFDLGKGFPLVTTKKVYFKSIVGELLWFLKGNTNIQYLSDNGITIWDEWCDTNGDLGPVYPHQWRRLKVDQIAYLINELKTNPNSRRLLVSSWNVEQLEDMALPPCHYAFECYVRDGVFLDLKWHQRSVDIALGLPFNIASYALLVHILAKECTLLPGRLIGDLGNCHIYSNHVPGLEEQITREPLPLCTVTFNKKHWENYSIEDFSLIGYNSHSSLKFEVAV